MAAKITRTINHSVLTLRVFDSEHENVGTITVNCGDIVKEGKEKLYLEKNKVLAENLTVIKVLGNDIVGELYEMPVTTFIAHATVVKE